MMDIKNFVEFNNEENEDKCLEDEEHFRLSDNEAQNIIFKVSKCKNIAEFQTLDIKTRNLYIKKLKEKGLSIRQISRLTGLSKGIVERI